MLQRHKAKQDTARRRKQVAFTLPATTKALCHGIPIVNIHSTRDGTIVSVREDGVVCCWSPEPKPLKTKHIFVCFNFFLHLSEHFRDMSGVIPSFDIVNNNDFSIVFRHQ